MRRQVAQLLAKVKEPKVQALLTNLLDDTDADVQAESVRLIGELRIKASAADLAGRLSKARRSCRKKCALLWATLRTPRCGGSGQIA